MNGMKRAVDDDVRHRVASAPCRTSVVLAIVWRPGALRVGLLLGALLVGPAMAQLQLPGANNGVAPNSAPRPAVVSGAEPYVAPKPAAMKPPGEDTIAGHTISLDGQRGSMGFTRSGADLTLTALTLTGDKISKPNQGCTVSVALPKPLVVTPAGRPAGTIRYDVPIAACPFSIDVLDGAVLVSRPDGSCSFRAADCLVAPAGLWGPPAADISPGRVKDLERQRTRTEAAMRANFRSILKKAGKDRQAVKTIAGEQAAFSSDREVTCRDYQGESVHGFCSTQIAEARALALLAKFDAMAEGPHDHRRPSRATPRSTKPSGVGAGRDPNAPAEQLPK